MSLHRLVCICARVRARACARVHVRVGGGVHFRDEVVGRKAASLKMNATIKTRVWMRSSGVLHKETLQEEGLE